MVLLLYPEGQHHSALLSAPTLVYVRAWMLSMIIPFHASIVLIKVSARFSYKPIPRLP